MRRLTVETEETLYKVGFVSALAVVIALTLWWTVYRDGGVAYYAKVHEPRSQFSVIVTFIERWRKMLLVAGSYLNLRRMSMIPAPSLTDKYCA